MGQATLVSEEDEDFTETIYKKRKISNVDSEIKRYLQEDNLDKEEDPLDYWRMKSNTYPSLTMMARTYLAVPSTSTPAERAFSKGRLVLHYIRSSLYSLSAFSAEKIRALMCLSSWFDQGFC